MPTRRPSGARPEGWRLEIAEGDARHPASDGGPADHADGSADLREPAAQALGGLANRREQEEQGRILVADQRAGAFGEALQLDGEGAVRDGFGERRRTAAGGPEPNGQDRQGEGAVVGASAHAFGAVDVEPVGAVGGRYLLGPSPPGQRLGGSASGSCRCPSRVGAQGALGYSGMMVPKDATPWPSTRDGALSIGAKLVKLPGLILRGELGRGANAVVFEGLDEVLGRRVAVKVWNARGKQRARAESAKIAQFSHPLIVVTHQFGLINGHPYAVMEFVDGTNGKLWLKDDPPVSSRLGVWRQYSSAIRHIHDSGTLHGDPHLGNVLVCSAQPLNPSGQRTRDPSPVVVKVADTGTSEVWSSRPAFAQREAALIRETAGRLFDPDGLDKVWYHPSSFDHRQTREVLDDLHLYLECITGLVDWDRRGSNAEWLADHLTKTPLFHMDVVLRQVEQTGITTADRLMRRINMRLFRTYDFDETSTELTAESREAYSRLQADYVARGERRAEERRG